jgi:dUTP pyrophosphatase
MNDISMAQSNRVVEDIIHFKQGDVVIFGLGVAIELPINCEAEIRPRSSTFKHTGLLLTNSVGTIDESYKGNNDEWQAMFYATRDGHVKRFDRLLQFKVSGKMVKPDVEYVESLDNEDRGSYGTTGK